MTFQEAKEHLSRKLDILYSDIANNDQFTDTDLGVLIQLGVSKAWDYKPWPFTQKRSTGTTDNTGATNGYYTHPTDMVIESAFLLRVNGKEYKKLDFLDYLKTLEDDSAYTGRIWAEWAGNVYINRNAYTVGQTYEMLGKSYAATLSGTSDLLPFSPVSDNSEFSGNESIVQFGYAEALDSEKKSQPQQAEIERKKAYQTLELLWKPFAERKALMQSKGRPMFNVPDFFAGNNSSQNIGNFNY